MPEINGEPVLSKIARSVEARVGERKALVSEATLRKSCLSSRVPFHFCKAFENVGTRIIAEIKFASPSQGPIADPREMSPVSIAREYLKSGAAALSILTEQDYFGGSQEYLVQIRQAFPEAYLLQKDFILDEYQLLESRINGADAVLLIVALLGEEKTARLMRSTADLGLTALIEVHNEAEMESAIKMGAKLIGINNRDLKSLEVSLNTSFRMSTYAAAHPEVCMISESGLSGASDLIRLRDAGFSGFLIGSSFMKTGAPGEALRQLLQACERGKP